MAEAALLGALGALSVEAVELMGALRRTKRLPWQIAGEPGLSVFLVSVAIRVLAAASFTAVLGSTDQISTPLAAIGSGIAVPLILERLLQSISPIVPGPVDRDKSDDDASREATRRGDR